MMCLQALAHVKGKTAEILLLEDALEIALNYKNDADDVECV